MTRAGPLDKKDRAIRIATASALLLLAWGYRWDGVIGIGAIVLAVAALATAAVGFSPLDAAFARVDGGVVGGRRTLLHDPRLAFVWLAARLWLGWVWLHAGWEKITDSAWVGGKAPAAIDGFLTNAASPEMTSGAHASVPTWYAWLIDHAFLHADTFLSYLVAIGEFALGIALILGLLTMLSAFFSGFMILNFMLAGSLGAGENPIILGLSVVLMAAGAAAYVYGVDRVVMPRLRGWLRRLDRRAARRGPVPAH